MKLAGRTRRRTALTRIATVAGVIGVLVGSLGAPSAFAGDDAGTTPAPPEIATAGASVAAPADTANVGLVTWVDGQPAAWPITATIVGPTTATFADGTTTAQLTTDATGEPAVLELRSVPSSGVQLRLVEPLRTDASFRDVVCESSHAPYPFAPIERGAELTVFPLDQSAQGPAWGDGRPYPVCWFEHTSATRVTITSQLDGAGPVAGFEVGVLPTIGQVGQGGVPDADGIFPTATAPTQVELGGFESAETTDVFVGQVALAGTTIYGVECVTPGRGDGEPDVVVNGPLEARAIGDRTLVGVVVQVSAHSDVACTIDNANADLEATKQASTTDVGPGTVFSYTIVASNAGRAPLFDVSLDDPVPSSLTVLDVTADESTTACRSTGNQVDCDYGDLLPGDVRTVRLTVSVRPDVVDTSSITNVAIVSGEVPLWVPSLDVAPPLPIEAVVRPPVFATALQVVVTNVVRAVSPAAATTSTTSAAAPATTVAATLPAVDQQSPTIPTVATPGAVLPRTGVDVSLVTVACWFAVVGLALLGLRRLRVAGRR